MIDDSIPGSSGTPYLEIKIATKTDTDVTLTFKETGQQAGYHIPGGTVYPIDLSKVQGNVPPNNTNLGDMLAKVYLEDNPDYLYNPVYHPPQTPNGIYNKSLHIESSSPISVYAFNTGSATTDATLLMPTQTWGTDYYRLSYKPEVEDQDIEMIIAKEDDTELFLNGAITSFATIDAGEIYITKGDYSTQEDMTGRHITSSRPVAYFTHNSNSVITVQPAGDTLFEQLAPVDQWGTNFLVPAAPAGISIANRNHIRIMASEDDTMLQWDTSMASRVGGTVINSGDFLDAGQWVELLFVQPSIPIPGDAGACYIQADKPIGVATYMPSGGAVTNFNDPNGDPAIARIPSLEQLTDEVLIAPFLFDPNVDNIHTMLDLPSAVHYMMLIAPTETATQTVVTMDSGATTIDITNGGTNPWIENPASSTIGSTKYSYIRYQFDNITHYEKSFDIKNPRGVMVLVGGVGWYESYYYNAGSGACVIN
jgi:hypothetical protein